MKTQMHHDFPLAKIVAWDLTMRSGLSEHLDDFSTGDPYIAATLRNLEQVNIWLSGIRRLCDAMIFKAPQVRKKNDVTIVDLGCGGGDLALWLSKRCVQKGMDARIIGIDHDPRIVEIARQRCCHDRAITILHQTADSIERLPGAIDWIVSNHFLHHLDEKEIVRLLRAAAGRAGCGVVMNDLVRSRAALVGFWFLSRAARPAGHTAHDGIVSILRSYTKKEIGKILDKAGLPAAVRRSGIGHQSIVMRLD
jgi:2-polyprenyl-3-methyl-5-hydroxy-6-metoxy-1,4-benzoquinol methylase